MSNRGGSARRVATVLSALLAAIALVAGCSSDGGGGSQEPDGPVAKVTVQPGDGSDDVNPTAPISVSVTGGRIDQVALSNPSGKQVTGELNADHTKYTVTEPLGYGVTYNWTGTATGTDGKPVPIDAKFSTVQPKSTVSATINIGDGQEVGIAAPIIVQFNKHIENKAAAEKAMVVTTTPAVEGSWAWLQDDNGGSRAHWRPREYWTPGTKVDLQAKLYGVDMGDGVYGGADMSTDFTIGRSQIVKANAPSHRMQVVRDGQVIMDIPVSYGEGDQDRNVTRSGIHVVTEKYEDFMMSNPPFYENVRERWAVRISNNGEFIHANPESLAAQGNTNVTNGCINLSPADAQAYFPTALYGDPVEVTGTRIPLSAADGDVYDWTIDWNTWKSLSALDGSSDSVVSATPVAPGPPRGN